MKSDTLSIEDIRPTIYFKRFSGRLHQSVDIRIHNPGKCCQALLMVQSDMIKEEINLERIKTGKTDIRIFLPDVRSKIDAIFCVLTDRGMTSVKKMEWRPSRYWKVHLCQAAHFDPGYTDLPSNVMRDYLSFLDQVVKWCEKTEKEKRLNRFHYTIEQSWIALHYITNRPADQVKKFVHFCRNGQIEVNALFANMTSELLGTEEAARLLYPAFFLKRRYGIPIRTAEHNDVPGISWSYATLLSDAGIKYFIPGIPDYFNWGEEKHPWNFDVGKILPRNAPEAFFWEAQNQKRILVYLHQQGSSGCSDPALSDLPCLLEDLANKCYKYTVLRYYLSGGKRDNAPPLFDWVKTVKDWNEKWTFPQYILSTNYEFFKALEKELPPDLPVFRGDYPGTDYPLGAISTARDTAAARVASDTLHSAECLAAIASETTDYEYPGEFLDNAWLDLLKYHEHAWGIAQPLWWAMEGHRREKETYAYRAAALAEDVMIKSSNRLADQIHLTSDSYHIVVFNPLHFQRTDLVEIPLMERESCSRPMHLKRPNPESDQAPVWFGGTAIGRNLYGLPGNLMDEPFSLVDLDTGKPVPCQLAKIESASDPQPFAAERYNLSVVDRRFLYTLHFIAPDIPAFGYKTFKIVFTQKSEAIESDLRAGPFTLENRYYKISVDEKSGGITSILDKQLGRELVDREALWQFNMLFARKANDVAVEFPSASTVTIGRSGPLIASLLIRGSIPGAPELTLEIILYQGAKRIDFVTRLLKDADGTRRYYIAFPFRIKNPRFNFEGPLNVIRPVEDQFPGTTTDYYAVNHWADVWDRKDNWGVSFSSKDAPLFQFGENWPDYVSQAHHGTKPAGFNHKFLTSPDQFLKGYMFSYVANNNFRTNFQVSQPGVILLRYSLRSHQGDWKEGRARDFGWGFSCPPVSVILKGPQRGKLPPSSGFCRIDSPNILVTTLKRAENSPGLVIRLLETEGRDSRVTVHLPFLKFRKAVETNIVEEDLRVLKSGKNRFSVRIKPWSVATVRLVK